LGAVILALVGDKALSQQLLRSYELAAHCKTVDAVCKAYLGGYMDATELFQLWITTQMTIRIDIWSLLVPVAGGCMPA
jgi:hypothetical protein